MGKKCAYSKNSSSSLKNTHRFVKKICIEINLFSKSCLTFWLLMIMFIFHSQLKLSRFLKLIHDLLKVYSGFLSVNCVIFLEIVLYFFQLREVRNKSEIRGEEKFF